MLRMLDVNDRNVSMQKGIGKSLAQAALMMLAKRKRDEEEKAKKANEIDFVKQIELQRNVSHSDEDFDSELFPPDKNEKDEVLDNSQAPMANSPKNISLKLLEEEGIDAGEIDLSNDSADKKIADMDKSK